MRHVCLGSTTKRCAASNMPKHWVREVEGIALGARLTAYRSGGDGLVGCHRAHMGFPSQRTQRRCAPPHLWKSASHGHGAHCVALASVGRVASSSKVFAMSLGGDWRVTVGSADRRVEVFDLRKFSGPMEQGIESAPGE